jgi:HD superfamily phosphohydrolase
MEKILNDPVHGHISLDPITLQIIDTPQFQRLRFLKQLGSAYYVFPGASHNRFEHSIGVCHLASEMISSIRSKQPELNISDSDVKCIKVAALCHDLGHGPFSHIFDNEFMPKMCPEQNFCHEMASEEMLSQIVLENEIDLDQVELTFIKDLIHGMFLNYLK